jgi:plastocyanin
LPVGQATPNPQEPKMNHQPGKTSHRVLVHLLVLLCLAIAGVASAHGPTIDVSHSELTPKLLNLFVGTTVHFNNTVEMPGGHVIVDESGTIKSPALMKPGDGWHYTFEEEGTFELYIEQHPQAKARIVVVPKH